VECLLGSVKPRLSAYCRQRRNHNATATSMHPSKLRIVMQRLLRTATGKSTGIPRWVLHCSSSCHMPPGPFIHILYKQGCADRDKVDSSAHPRWTLHPTTAGTKDELKTDCLHTGTCPFSVSRKAYPVHLTIDLAKLKKRQSFRYQYAFE
jgi:hypothetical protein